jgi:hypothetical protein
VSTVSIWIVTLPEANEAVDRGVRRRRGSPAAVERQVGETSWSDLVTS